ncbi:MAG: hypothetical protein RL380_815, partial [Verrucomicrobiota bacterium]
EIDFSIADFVADFRAATPSAAAEIITEGVFASREFVAEAPGLLRRALNRGVESATENFATLNARLTRLHPRRRLDDSLQRLDDLRSGLLRTVTAATRDRSLLVQNFTGRLARLHPSQGVKRRRELLRQLERRLTALGPQQVLARGYSLTTDAVSGKIIRRSQGAKSGQKLRTRVADGEIRSTVD